MNTASTPAIRGFRGTQATAGTSRSARFLLVSLLGALLVLLGKMLTERISKIVADSRCAWPVGDGLAECTDDLTDIPLCVRHTRYTKAPIRKLSTRKKAKLMNRLVAVAMLGLVAARRPVSRVVGKLGDKLLEIATREDTEADAWPPPVLTWPPTR